MKPFGPVPNERQLKWHSLEFYAFIHFTVNTFTDKEWGYGDEHPDVFNPTEFDSVQIVNTVKDCGMRGLVLTCKHHDGFCLWPSAYTEHSVKNSSWMDGKGDVVRDMSDACREAGIAFGIYLSPWDRNHSRYGRAEYVEYYLNQLEELLTNYGDIYYLWLDGANGGTGYYGGAREERSIDKDHYYQWDRVEALLYRLQKNAVIFSGHETDVRWIGNEEGYCPPTCWHRYTPEDHEKGLLTNGDPRHSLTHPGDREGRIWQPAEVNTSIRPGWFYHEYENVRVRTPDDLLDLYYRSVGRGACLHLNLPPDTRGKIHENDVRSLREFRRILSETLAVDLSRDAQWAASSEQVECPVSNVVAESDSFWSPNKDDKSPSIIISFTEETQFSVVEVQEHLPLGQRIWGWALDCEVDGTWIEFANGESIGNRLLWRGDHLRADKIRIRITAYGDTPVISRIGVYDEPHFLKVPRIQRNADGAIEILGNGTIHYTTDGSEPSATSPEYTVPFDLKRGGTVKARAFANESTSYVASATFGYDSSQWKVVAVSSEKAGWSGGLGSCAIDGDPETVWHAPEIPASIDIDLGEEIDIEGFVYTPQRDGRKKGLAKNYRFFTSLDGNDWRLAADDEFGNIENNPVAQKVHFGSAAPARYVRLVVTAVIEADYAVVSGISIISR